MRNLRVEKRYITYRENMSDMKTINMFKGRLDVPGKGKVLEML